jgi:hypothetical protein
MGPQRDPHFTDQAPTTVTVRHPITLSLKRLGFDEMLLHYFLDDDVAFWSRMWLRHACEKLRVASKATSSDDTFKGSCLCASTSKLFQ